MSVNATTLGIQTPAAVAEKWDKILLKTLKLVGVYQHLAMDDSAKLGKAGDTLHIRKIGGISTFAYDPTDATPISYVAPTVSDVILKLDSNAAVAIPFSEWTQAVADVDVQAGALEEARYSLSKAIDTYVMGKIIAAVPLANKLAAFDATAATSGDVYAQVLAMAAVLKKAGAVPLTNASDLEVVGDTEVGYIVMNPDAIKFLYQEQAFVKVDSNTFSQGSMFKSGKIAGTIAGLVILESSNLPTTTSTVTVFGGIKKATHMAVVKATPGKFIDAESSFVVYYRSLWIYGAVVSYPEALVSCVWTVAEAAS